eukprot:5315250-Amphidinium_carterae.1
MPRMHAHHGHLTRRVCTICMTPLRRSVDTALHVHDKKTNAHTTNEVALRRMRPTVPTQTTTKY